MRRLPMRMPEGVTHKHLLRAMDALMDHAEQVERELAKEIRPLVDQDLAVVFYDLTTVRIHGEGTVEDDLRAYGMSKERGGIARRFVLGVVQTANGLPLTPADAVTRYRALADIERGFRVLKSDIEIAPVHHRLPDRIRANALICFLARIQRHQAKIGERTLGGLSATIPEQLEIFDTLSLPKPV